MRILAVSDVVDEAISASMQRRAGSVDLVIGCGDLPYEYLDFVATSVEAPLRAVHGNHDVPLDQIDDPAMRVWWGGIDLHGRVVDLNGVLIAGLEGSPRYSTGPFQYSELEMWLQILRLLPSLLLNRLRRGRFLDVLVTHAPPRGIHDESDTTHRGFVALRWFLRELRPRFHLHGHTHVYDSRTSTTTQFGLTTVVNAYGAKTIEL
ncbi:MAG TPA: metallophosphoesterase [Candidatus Dormibacteraeota bacterium]|nr:metallophosphoesterase [Candidatus Dormibacteraeota bacterium]